MDLDFLSGLLNEVALEGLDGITLSMLWLRLENRPHFPIALDKDSKVFFWECIAVQKDIEIFELPHPRKCVPIYDRYNHVDNEIGIVLESSEPIIDIYPVVFVRDGDIRGSCSTYKSRVCITSEIRYDDVLLMSLGQVNERWGEALVLVASPKVRLLALIGTETNPLIDLSQEEYCLLERIGRSRYHGEVTQGEGGLLKLKAPFCKQLHYYRKKLSLKGLVTKQLHYLKSKKGVAITGSLFHLTKFYVQRKTKMLALTKCICDILKNRPKNRELFRVLREELNIKEGTFKKLFHRPFQKWIRAFTVLHREFYPEATLKESFTANGQERILKIVELIKPFDEGDNNEDEEINDDKEQCLSLNIYFDCSKVYHDVPLMLQIYRLILEAGPEGLPSSEIGRRVTLPRLDIRTLLRSLIKKNLIVTILQEKGRQKETKYIAKSYSEKNEAYSKLKAGELHLQNGESLTHLKQKIPALTGHSNLKRKHADTSKNSSETSSNKKVRFDDEVGEVILETQVSAEKESSNVQDFQKIVTEISEIETNDIFTGKAPKLISLTEQIESRAPRPNVFQLTYRKIQRMNLILANLKSVGFTTLSDLQKFLAEKEKEEGYNFKLDKKSTARLVNDMHVKKKLRIHKAVLTLDDQKAQIEFICDNSVLPNNAGIQVAIEQAKFKYFSVTKDKLKKSDKEILSTDVSNNKENEINKDDLSSVENTKVLQLQTHPKFTRFKTLHKFLFYIVHQYEGHSANTSNDPVVYHDSMSWKRFVPPLCNSDQKQGWCFLANVYARMPLSVFVRVVNLRSKIKEFSEYLCNEEKSHYLLTHLPIKLCNSLFHNRKYLFALDEVMKNLCYLGLITFGPQPSKLKEQKFIYVHKIASIFDTTISTPGYLHISKEVPYDKKLFSFNTLADLDKFWMELESISFHTPLGKYSSVAGKTIAVTMSNHKSELIEAMKPRSFDEISDVGFIPGDGLGAGGYDSSLFLHSRRNWHFANIKDSLKADKNLPKANPTNSIQNLLKNKELFGPESCNRLQRLSQYHLSSQKDKILRGNVIKKNKESVKTNKASPSKSPPLSLVQKKKRKVQYRVVRKVRDKKIRSNYTDEKDRVAIQKMSRVRCDWTAQEDSFLLLCKVTSSFLDPASRTLVVPYTVIRDLLHGKFPEISATKSSRACQRRVRYMMLNPATTNNVAVFLGEAKQDINLVTEFDRVKPARSNETAWAELFRNLLKRLIEKFTLPAANRCKNISIPISMEKFKHTFDILSPRNEFHSKNNHSDPTTEDEVKYFTLYSLIVSAMSIIPDGTEWSYLLYKLYQVYPENILRSVVSHLRSEKVIALKNRACRKDLQRSLMSTFPYRLSITYENSMLTKFPIKLFNESKELLDNLKCMGNEQSLELKGDISPGYTIAVLALSLLTELSLTIQVPEQIILFDSSLSKEARSNIVERMINTLSDKESLELSRILSHEKEFSLNARKTDHNQSQSLNENVICHQLQGDLQNKSVDTAQTNEIQRSTNASRFALYLLRQELSQPPIEKVQHSQDYIVLNSCKIFCHLKSHSHEISPDPSSMSHIKKNMNEHRGKILTDGCISEIKASLTAFIPPGAFTQYNNFDEALEMIYDAYSPQTLSDAKCIFQEIFKANITGISEKTIWEKFRFLAGELSWFEHLHLFREAMLVIRAGIASFVYVCICYAKSWVITSYVLPKVCFSKEFKDRGEYVGNKKSRNLGDCKNDDLQKTSELHIEETRMSTRRKDCKITSKSTSLCDSNDPTSDTYLEDSAVTFDEKIYFLPRSWRHPDGTLNKTVFRELLQTVLSYIFNSPGISISRVVERFSLALQPVQTLELLEILEKACCIVKYYCKKPKKRTLFSPPSFDKLVITKNPDPEDIDHLEPLPDAVCNLAKIQEAIM